VIPLRGRGGRRLATVLALVALAASCGSEAAPRRTSRLTLTTLLPASEKTFWEFVARAFERHHPEIRVDLVEGPESTDLREDLYTASLLARDPTFDLIYMDVTWTPKFAAAGWLLPLDEWFDARERARFLPAALAAGLYEGRLFRILIEPVTRGPTSDLPPVERQATPPRAKAPPPALPLPTRPGAPARAPSAAAAE